MPAFAFHPMSTKRLRLRSLTGNDAGDVLSIVDPWMLDFLPPALTRTSVAKFLQAEDDHYIGAFDRHENALIGIVGLHIYPVPAKTKRIELSYLIARRAERQGFAGEAARELVLFSEKTCSFSVVAQVRSTNVASRRVLARLGFIEAKNEISAERGYRLMEKTSLRRRKEATR